jgi:hypothetical protein
MFDTHVVNQQPTDEYGLLHRMLPLQPKHNPRYGKAQQKKETIPVAITTTSTYPSSAKTHHAKTNNNTRMDNPHQKPGKMEMGLLRRKPLRRKPRSDDAIDQNHTED